MVRKITALLMILSVAVLCTAPTFATGSGSSVPLYPLLYNYIQSTNSSTFESLGSSNMIHFDRSTANGIYNVGIVFRLCSDSSQNIEYNLQNEFTYNGEVSFRFLPDPSNSSTVDIDDFYLFAFRLNQDVAGDSNFVYPFNFNKYTFSSTNSVINLTNLDSFSFVYSGSAPSNSPFIFTFNYVFHTVSEIDFNDYDFLVAICSLENLNPYRSFDTYITSTLLSASYDPYEVEYGDIVKQQLNSIQSDISNGFSQNHQDLQNIQNNLDSIDSSVQGVGDKVDDMSQDIQDKLEEIKQQEADDVQDGFDSAEEAGEALEDGIDLTFTESINQLYNSISYNGTDFNFQLPASGTIPFLNAQLWNTQNIPLKQYIDYMPPVVLIVIRFLLGLGFALYVVHEIRSIISMINGSKGD